jgi:CubicO group peptidase (beta-lactamase class C family)
MSKKQILVLLLLSLAPFSLFAEKVPVEVVNHELSAEFSKQIEEYVLETMKNDHSPGIAIGIVKDDRLVYEGYFGWADIEEKKPVDRSTVFRIGSISKTFTAIALMQEWEKGKFKLDDDFNSVFNEPVIKQKSDSCEAVTFKHMLTHTSGGGEFMSYKQLLHPTHFYFTPPSIKPKPLAEYYTDGMRPGVCPETKFCYCNYCFGAIGVAIQEMSGLSFEDDTRQLFDSIGMKDSTFYGDSETLSRLATGYKYKNERKGYEPNWKWQVPIPPMGNAYSTVPDMAKYLTVLINNGESKHGKLLDQETMELMYDTHYTLDERMGAVGLAFFKSPSTIGTRIIGHSGGVFGYGAQMQFSPDKKTGVIVFGNVSGAPPYKIGDWIIKEMVGYEEPEKNVEPDKSKWEDLEGTYEPEQKEFLTDFRYYYFLGGPFKVKVKGDNLMIRYGGAYQNLKQVEPDDPYFYEIIEDYSEMPIHIKFERDENGKVKSIILHMNRYVKK